MVENVDPFTTAELRRILAAPAVDDNLVTLLALWSRTGFRASEVMGLQPQDVDHEAGTLIVRRSWSRQRLGPTKTGRERRVSFGHPTAEDAQEWRPSADIADTMATRLRRLKRTPLDPAGFLSTQPDGRPWSSSPLNSAWRRVLRAAKVRYRPAEQLRHTVASTLSVQGRAAALCPNCRWLAERGRTAQSLCTVDGHWIGTTNCNPGATATDRGAANLVTRPLLELVIEVSGCARPRVAG